MPLCACTVLYPDRTAPKSTRYQIQNPPEPWHQIKVGEDPNAIDALKADLAFENPQSGAIISLNSICRKYTEGTLEALTNNLVRGIEERELVVAKNIPLAGDIALDSFFTGKVDGIKLNIRTVVLRKELCTYDFIYVVIPQKEGQSRKVFDEFIASFRAD